MQLRTPQKISINNDSGGEASITVSGGTTGIIVNAPAAGYVNLRGLTIQGVGFGGGTGLRFNTGFSLTITNCVFRNHTGEGIELFPTASSNLSVSNTLVADNGGTGIRVFPSGSGTVKAVFNRVEVSNNSINGILVDGSGSTAVIRGTVADSVAANNGNTAVQAFGVAGHATINLMVVRSVVANNKNGVVANGSPVATVRLGQSTVTGNQNIGLLAGDGASLASYGDNNVDANTVDGAPSGTLTKK